VHCIEEENSLLKEVLTAESYSCEKSIIDHPNTESKLALKISQLGLEKEAIQSRQAIELLQKENQELLNTRDTLVLSAITKKKNWLQNKLRRSLKGS
jgi:hypothetical protein